ncbi:hypothetical protein CSV67_09140 [Sporosarcina sp. P2]|uniref:hypothetical protein n=1 Tax=Sporosarcina sp. P2 TaxID=2048251 RepID=UPI000C17240E|nr:hypothetical protein [Sporosarcina sp. P2]PID02456.1 hypothetical protein CSV67_09140 [Sporosarcina sp. P2]
MKEVLLAKYGSANVQVLLKAQGLEKITTLGAIADAGKPFNDTAVEYKDGDIEGTFVNVATGEDVVIGEVTPPVVDLAVESVMAITDTVTKETTVTATVTNSEENATATVTVTPDAALEAEDIVVEDVAIDAEGNISANLGVLPAGTHSVVVTVGEVSSEAVTFTVEELTEDEAAVVEASAAVVVAEESKLQDDVDAATALVDALEDSDVKTALTDRLTAVQEAIDTEAAAQQAAVDAVNAADTQIKLATALKSPYFVDNYKEENIVAYSNDLTNDYTTVAEVNNAVKAINDAIVAGSKFDVVEEALNEAHPNQLTIISVLNDNFENVESDYINEYVNEIYTTGAVTLTSLKEIQDAIDLVNADKAVEAAEDASGDLAADGNATQKEINAAQGLHDAANTLVEALDDTAALKAGTDQAALVGQLVVVQNEIDAAQDALDDMNVAVVAANEALAAYKAAEGDLTDAVYTDLVAALAASPKVEGTITAATTALVDATEEITIVGVALENLAGFADAFGENADQETVYTDVVTELGGDLENPSIQTDVDTLKGLLTTLNAETKKWETYNAVVAATDAAQMRTLLFEFANTEYVDLTSAQKLEFAERFIAAVADEDNTTANFGDINTLLGTEVTTYAGLIDAVNDAETITAMRAALAAISADYAALGAQAQTDIAEDILTKKPFATITAIVAAMGL